MAASNSVARSGLMTDVVCAIPPAPEDEVERSSGAEGGMDDDDDDDADDDDEGADVETVSLSSARIAAVIESASVCTNSIAISVLVGAEATAAAAEADDEADAEAATANGSPVSEPESSMPDSARYRCLVELRPVILTRNLK